MDKENKSFIKKIKKQKKKDLIKKEVIITKEK